MSDALCVGVCMFDPDSGVCLGCGRTPEEIAGESASEPDTAAPSGSAAENEAGEGNV